MVMSRSWRCGRPIFKKCLAMTKAIVGLALCMVLFASSSFAGSPAYQRAESMTCSCGDIYTNEERGRYCRIAGLAIPVETDGPAVVRLCYDVFGNPLGRHHDGVNTGVLGPDGEMHAIDALAPPALWPGWPGSSSASGCESLYFDTPQSWVAQVVAVYDVAGRPQQWGCHSPKPEPNAYQPSWLTVEITPIP